MTWQTRIVTIGATCSSRWRKKWWEFFRVNFTFFNLHPMFWFQLRLLFQLELVFQWNLWDFSEIDYWIGPMAINLLEKNWTFRKFFLKPKLAWFFKHVGLKLGDNLLD